uniref:Uncharacterized protein n=1 Tax=Alexandrium monilatum TaxID=311494 RepID=A0A7S4Q273_9DINO
MVARRFFGSWWLRRSSKKVAPASTEDFEPVFPPEPGREGGSRTGADLPAWRRHDIPYYGAERSRPGADLPAWRRHNIHYFGAERSRPGADLPAWRRHNINYFGTPNENDVVVRSRKQAKEERRRAHSRAQAASSSSASSEAMKGNIDVRKHAARRTSSSFRADHRDTSKSYVQEDAEGVASSVSPKRIEDSGSGKAWKDAVGGHPAAPSTVGED